MESSSRPAAGSSRIPHPSIFLALLIVLSACTRIIDVEREHPRPGKRNVCRISLDTLRADPLSSSG